VYVPDPVISRADGTNPGDEALPADSVGLALHVVLETLTPPGGQATRQPGPAPAIRSGFTGLPR